MPRTSGDVSPLASHNCRLTPTNDHRYQQMNLFKVWKMLVLIWMRQLTIVYCTCLSVCW